jgi:hypothetical protein
MTFLERVVKAMGAHKVPFALAGGYAVALHGAIRGTVDVDIVIRLRKNDFIAAEASMKSLGLMPRLPVTAEEVFQFREEYINRRNLIAWSFVNPDHPVEIVDILLAEDLTMHEVVRVRAVGKQIPVLGIGDLIRMKKRSGRPQDLEDVRALESIRKAKS